MGIPRSKRPDAQLIGIASFGGLVLLVAVLGDFDRPAFRYGWLYDLLGPDNYRLLGRTLLSAVAIGCLWAFRSRMRFLRRVRTYVSSRSQLEIPPVVESRSKEDAG